MTGLERDEMRRAAWTERAACIVPIEYFPPSLHDPVWTAAFRKGSILSQCVSNLRRMSPFPILVVTPECTSEILREHLQTLPAELLLTVSVRTLPAIREAAQRLDLRSILAVHGGVGFGLLPDSVLSDLLELHRAQRSDVTAADGLPKPFYAHCYEIDGLDALCQISQAASAPDNPQFAIDALRAAIQALPPRDDQFKLTYINVPERYGLTECPKFIPCERAEDLRLLDSILPPDGTISDPNTILGCLRKRITDDLESSYRPRPRRCRRRNRPRVLYASNPSAYSGGEECLVNSIRSLGPEIEPHALIALEGRLTEQLRSIGVSVHCPGIDFAVPTAKNFILVSDVLDRVKPDIAHANAVVGAPLLAACARRGVPTLLWMRRADTVGMDEHLASADRITAVSRFVAACVSGEMIRRDKICVLHDGVDCERFSPDRKPLRDWRTDERVILCIARFVPNKRHDVLLGAFARLAREEPKARLVLVGTAPAGGASTYAQCVAMVDANGLSDRVLFAGFQRDVLDFEQRADVVVLCSEQEPFGTVVLESMAMGRPVVVSESGGLPEIVEDGVSGLYCQPGSPDSLYDSLVRILRDRSLAEDLGAGARRAAMARFSLPVHASALRAIYSGVP